MKTAYFLLAFFWIQGVWQRTPLVQIEGGFGTGLVVKNGYVLTAYHLLGPNLTVNKMPAQVVAFQENHDLMLLKVDIKGKASFADPLVDQEVAVIHYGFGIKQVTRGRVASIEPAGKYILLDITTPQGSSGAAVYNEHGKVVGMVTQRMWDEGYANETIAINSKRIRAFLKEVLP